MKPFTKAEKEAIYEWSKECGGHNSAKSLFSDRIPKQEAIHTADIASAIELAPYFTSSSVSTHAPEDNNRTIVYVRQYGRYHGYAEYNMLTLLQAYLLDPNEHGRYFHVRVLVNHKLNCQYIYVDGSYGQSGDWQCFFYSEEAFTTFITGLNDALLDNCAKERQASMVSNMIIGNISQRKINRIETVHPERVSAQGNEPVTVTFTLPRCTFKNGKYLFDCYMVYEADFIDWIAVRQEKGPPELDENGQRIHYPTKHERVERTKTVSVTQYTAKRHFGKEVLIDNLVNAVVHGKGTRGYKFVY